MLQTLIIEDEPASARRLERILTELNVYCVAKVASVGQGIELLKKQPKLDFILADIQLGDGTSFDIFNEVECKIPIIFTTAYDQYAIKAFKLNSVDYLLKPVVKKELKVAIEKLEQKISLSSQTMKAILQQLNLERSKPNYNSNLLVRVGTKIKLLAMDDIIYFNSQDKASFVINKQNRSFALDDSLDKLMQDLDPELFFRVSRQYILHKKYISGYDSYASNRLKINLQVNTQEIILVSRDRVRKFKEWLTN